MNSNSYFEKTKMLSSVEAEAGAKRLIEKIENMDLGMDVLPNQFPRFQGELEEKDYVSYCYFLGSSNGKKVIKMLEEEDEGNFIEL